MFAGLFSQRSNLLSPRFWCMLADLVRFYAGDARRATPALSRRTLGDYLAAGRYGAAFRDDHILPMASAIWSARRRTCSTIPRRPSYAFTTITAS